MVGPSCRGLGRRVRVAALVVLACLVPGVSPLAPGPVQGQEAVLDLRGFPLDLAQRYLEHEGIRYEVDGRFPDPSTRVVVGQELITDPGAVAVIRVLQLFTEFRPPPEGEVVEVPVEVPVEVVREVPVEVVREVPVEVPAKGSRGVPWPLAGGLAVGAGLLSLIGCRTLGTRTGDRPEGGRAEVRADGARDEAVRDEGEGRERPSERGALPAFRAVIVDEAISSTGGAPEEVDP